MSSPTHTMTQRLANPTRFLALTAWLLPLFSIAAALTIAVGLYMAFFVAPTDYQQGDTVRIMFIHVPAAWLAMMGYAIVALSSFGLIVFRHPLADVSAKSAAPIGAAFTALALVTGSLWGKPMWGTYWVWDARLTSVLILFFLYLGLIALRSSLEDEALAGKLTAILAIVGVVILPFIKISVEGLNIPWLGINIPSWNTLHQPSSVLRSDGPKIHSSILIPLLVNAAGFSLLFFAMHLKAMKNEILRRRLAALTRAAIERAEREGARQDRRDPCHHGLRKDVMIDLGKHAVFIWASYGATAAVLIGLIGWLIADGRRLSKALADLEARGIRRRSDGG